MANCCEWSLHGDCHARSSNYNRAMMGRFRRFIDDLALKEIPLHGQQPTGGLHLGQVIQSALYSRLGGLIPKLLAAKSGQQQVGSLPTLSWPQRQFFQHQTLPFQGLLAPASRIQGSGGYILECCSDRCVPGRFYISLRLPVMRVLFLQVKFCSKQHEET
jgi:hypothetical protein